MKPSERINRTYSLKRTTIDFLPATGPVRGDVTVSLELSPQPQYVLISEFSSRDAQATNEIRSKGEVRFRLDNGHQLDVVDGDRWHLGGGKIGNHFILKSSPVTTLDQGTNPVRLKFALINFPSMWGDKDIKRPKPGSSSVQLLYQRFHLLAGPWFVDVIGVDSIMSVHHGMTRRGGSAITHIGTATRVDGQAASTVDFQRMLNGLHLFLSFARGSYCGLTMLSGHDSNRNRVWEQWGCYKVEPWRRQLLTWADGLSSHMLSPIFEGMWAELNRPQHGETLSQIVNWYLRSNESAEPESSIVLSQAALERLAADTVGLKGSRKEGDWIMLTLQKMGIDHNLPTHCLELTQNRNRFGWSHGPHALVDIRNDLVHADARKGPFSEAVLKEAQTLGLYYIELMLLKLCGYTGTYANRLKWTQPLHTRIEKVPWAVS